MSRNSLAQTGLGPGKFVSVKGSSSQPGEVSMFINQTLGTLVLYMGLLRSDFSPAVIFIFFYFSDRRSLKIENESNNMKTK